MCVCLYGFIWIICCVVEMLILQHVKHMFNFQVLNSRITSNGLVSTMTYLAPTDSELTLACWASNAVGRQEVPCLIHIIPASKWLKFLWHKMLNKINNEIWIFVYVKIARIAGTTKTL